MLSRRCSSVAAVVAICLIVGYGGATKADAESGSAIQLLQQCENALRHENGADTLICLSKAWSIQATVATLQLVSKGFELLLTASWLVKRASHSHLC
jgi:hypothetical protein